MKLLLERGADVHTLDGYGQTPYQTSLAYGYREIADLLHEHGAGRARSEDFFYGLTAMSDLHFDFSPSRLGESAAYSRGKPFATVTIFGLYYGSLYLFTAGQSETVGR